MNPERLILFDVDGTLIKTGALKYDWWHETIKTNFGVDVSIKEIYAYGKTDAMVLEELLGLRGIRNSFSDKKFLSALKDVGIIAHRVIKEGDILRTEGIEPLIKNLIEENFSIGLLTGNTKEKAKAKLENCGLWKYFKIGAFGDVPHGKRADLVGIAMEDARQKTGVIFKRTRVFVIGDTVEDIKCAMEGGVISVAVATGPEPADFLKKEAPNYLFENFMDIKKWLGVLRV